MNTTTLEVEKNRLIRQILDVDNIEVIKKIKNILHREEKIAEVTEEEEDRYLTKDEVLANFNQVAKEIRLRKEGKLKGTPLTEFLNEL